MTVNLPIRLIVLCLIGRIANILICSYLANLPRKEKTKFDLKKQVFPYNITNYSFSCGFLELEERWLLLFP
jgi:hypothetical protein